MQGGIGGVGAQAAHPRTEVLKLMSGSARRPGPAAVVVAVALLTPGLVSCASSSRGTATIIGSSVLVREPRARSPRQAPGSSTTSAPSSAQTASSSKDRDVPLLAADDRAAVPPGSIGASEIPRTTIGRSADANTQAAATSGHAARDSGSPAGAADSTTSRLGGRGAGTLWSLAVPVGLVVIAVLAVSRRLW